VITPDTRLALDPRVRFRRFEEEGIVINQKTAEALVVSDVGARLIELSDGRRTLGECVDVLGTEFEAGRDIIETDVLRFAEELVGAGVASPQ
jgi:hypothetical protein